METKESYDIVAERWDELSRSFLFRIGEQPHGSKERQELNDLFLFLENKLLTEAGWTNRTFEREMIRRSLSMKSCESR